MIEVLVVVAIIAILVAINLTVVDRYQSRTTDTAIGASLSQVRKVGAMIYTEANSYEFMCAVDNTLNDNQSALTSSG